MSLIRDLIAGIISVCLFFTLWLFMLPEYFGWLIAEPVPLDWLGLSGQVLSTSLALGFIAAILTLLFATQIRAWLSKI